MSDLGALQSCLAAEHAALYGYGIVAAVVNHTRRDSPDDRQATTYLIAHRQRRDELVTRLDSLGAQPVAALPAYDPSFDVTTAAAAVRLGRLIEQRCAAVYASAVAESSGNVRRDLARSVGVSAIAAVSWGARPAPFPGTRRR